ncbi:MAG: BspA family leucine-rich repeat surface protein [Ruminococcus sp.]|nr:BspA family leucine-rich repeat surface protein [Ruminococcus sp.]
MKGSFKKAVAAAMALLIVAGAAPFEPGTFSFVPKASITAEAAGTLSFNKTTGTLTISGGAFTKAQLQESAFVNNADVKKIVVENTAVFPADSSNLFENFLCKTIDISYADTSNVTTMKDMFKGCTNLTSVNMSHCNMKKVASFYELFYNCSALKTVVFTGATTSTSLTNMGYMFQNCSALTTLTDFSSLTTSGVTSFVGFLYNCKALTTLDLSSLNTSSAMNMSYMFYNCSALTSLDLSNFKTSKVTSMNSMFYGCSALTKLNIKNFDFSSVTNLASFLKNCSKLSSFTYPTSTSQWSTGKVTSMNGMFYGCSSLTTVPASRLNTSSVMNMGYMFHGCSSVTSIYLRDFDTSNVTNMASMFRGCTKVTKIDIDAEKFDTSKVTDMSYMFGNCQALNTLDVSGFNTGSVTDMNNMFWNCKALTALSLAKFDTRNVTNMSYMFQNCLALTKIDVSLFDTGSVKNMKGMFAGDKAAKYIYFGSKFDTYDVTDMSYMFQGCSAVTSLNLSRFCTYNVSTSDYMFDGCKSLETLYLSELWVNKKMLNGSSTGMFKECTSIVGEYNGTTYDASCTDAHYAGYGGGQYGTYAACYFPIYVAGTTVSSANMDDVLGDSAVSYDYANNTLHIDDDIKVPVAEGSTSAYVVKSLYSLNIYLWPSSTVPFTTSRDVSNKYLFDLRGDNMTYNVYDYGYQKIDAHDWNVYVAGKNTTVNFDEMADLKVNYIYANSSNDKCKLNIYESNIDVANTVYNFSGGITLDDCAVVAPASAKVSGGVIKNGSSWATNIKIRSQYANYAVLNTAQVTFGGALGLSFSVKLSDYFVNGYPKAFVRMKVNGRETTVNIADVKPNNGVYTFTCPVYSTEMRDTIEFKVCYPNGQPIELFKGSNGDAVENGIFKYTVADYLNAVAALTDSGYAKMVKLAKATLDYGAAAQIKFDHNKTGLGVSNDVEDLEFSDIDIYNLSITAAASRPSGVTGTANVEFGEDNTLFVVYTLPSGKKLEDYTFYIDGKAATPKSLGNRQYRLEVKNISPDNLATYHSFNCKEKSTGKQFYVKLNVLAYANTVAKSTLKAAEINMAKAMYLYYYAAADYSGKLPQ